MFLVNPIEKIILFKSFSVNQGSAKCSCLPPIFVKKVVVESSHVHLFSIVYECFHTAVAELSSYPEAIWPTKPNIFTIQIFTERIYRPVIQHFMRLALLGVHFGILTLELCLYGSGIGMFICENCYKEDHQFFLEFLGRWRVCVCVCSTLNINT